MIRRINQKLSHLQTDLSVGFFLAWRQVKRSSLATTLLIIFVMMLTFLNLVVVRGILVGLLQGSTEAYKARFAGDIILTNLPKKDFIENSPSVIEVAENLPWVEHLTYRYVDGGTVEAGYKTRVSLTDDPNSTAGSVVGINPEVEDRATGLAGTVLEGRYLTPEDSEGILIGANMLKKYLDIEAPGLTLLENVAVGDKVRLTIGDTRKEFVIRGFLQSKVDQVDFRMFILDSTFRNMTGRSDFNVDEVTLVLKPGSDPELAKSALIASGVDKYARVQTWEESLPKFLLDIQNTFGLLGNVVGSIGLVVASITIFIVIFVNAITRKKYIGILKGIGIDSTALEFTYVMQSAFYAVAGTLLGLLVLYGFLVPFVTAHPIKFPFSDGILVAEIPNTLVRAGLLLLATLIAGYIPARIVVKQNTLDAILGRK
jgi:ABC-type lipoprotein release transport system permease subunit